MRRAGGADGDPRDTAGGDGDGRVPMMGAEAPRRERASLSPVIFDRASLESSYVLGALAMRIWFGFEDDDEAGFDPIGHNCAPTAQV